MHRIAIYDLDRTLTAAPTWSAFLLFAARRRAPWRLALAPAAVAAMAAHKAGVYNRTRLKGMMQRLLIGPAIDAADLDTLARDFAVTIRFRPGAAARIAADRAAGYRPVVASAANAFYAQAIAARVGIGEVIATASRRDADGRVLAAIDGLNCHGAEKLARIERWLAEQDIAREDAYIRAYTDDRSDAPLLDWADEAFAVHPHAPLAKLAAARGWPRLDWNAA